MPDQSPSWQECQAARMACQEAIHRRLDGLQGRVDGQHQEVLDRLLEIKVGIAERAGRETGAHQAVRRWSWKEVGAAVAVVSAAVAAAVVAAWRLAVKAAGG